MYCGVSTDVDSSELRTNLDRLFAILANKESIVRYLHVGSVVLIWMRNLFKLLILRSNVKCRGWSDSVREQ